MENLLTRKKVVAAAVGVVLLVGVAFWQRTPVLTWYYLRELATADEDSRPTWVERVASLDDAVVPGLLDHLENPDPTVCVNAECALAALVSRWGAEDVRTLELAGAMQERFASFSPFGQIAAMQVMAHVLRQEGPTTWPAPVTRAAGGMLDATRERPEMRGTALVLAAMLLDRVPEGQWLDTCRWLADQGLSDSQPRTRLAAIQLLMRPALQGEHALLAKLVPMLRDKSSSIRRAALVALAPARDTATEDELLPLLHDPDLEIQQLCEAALRSRGLSDDHLELARLISDENPSARLRVFDRLGRAADLDASAWLRRLSHDSSPAVRAAAVRVAALHPRVNLTDRLREMAENDPSETVRQNALHYLQRSEGVVPNK
jgi:hypothetical protein